MRMLLDTFAQTLRTLWAHKLRSFLTMFGIAWGVGSLLLLAGLHRRVKDPSLNKVKLRWDYLCAQSERLTDLRYRPDSKWSAADAAKVVRYLKKSPHGVLPWLSIL